MNSVLHVPRRWRTRWKQAIEAVKADEEFKESIDAYYEECNKCDAQEVEFYKPLVDTSNAVLKVVSDSKFRNISSRTPQYYHRNDPKRIRGGIMSLSPDLVVLRKNYKVPKDGGLHWANPLHILEVKPFDGAMCDGATIPRLKVDGKQ